MADSRKIVVTGAASGIGASLVSLLRERGSTPIGVDVKGGAGVDVVADLSTPEGRAAMVAGVTEESGGAIDAIVANAGTAAYNHLAASVNFFGAVATLEGLRPLLLKSAAPRAVATVSIAAMMPCRDELVEKMLAGDEAGAVALAKTMETDASQAPLLYGSSKRALSAWLRRAAVSPEWGGAGIPINGVGPTVIETPMVAPFLSTDEGRKTIEETIPLPLHPNVWGKPEEVAKLLAFLISEDNSLVTGQIIFIDGGFDVVTRGADIFGSVAAPHALDRLSKFADK